jgi:hypothetical protein
MIFMDGKDDGVVTTRSLLTLAVTLASVIGGFIVLLNRTNKHWDTAFRCHELVSWSFTLMATTAAAFLQMPRACLVEFHVDGYCSGNRETPRRKVVASQEQPPFGSSNRETPRRKVVASVPILLGSI